jgi:hypothetical protein
LSSPAVWISTNKREERRPDEEIGKLHGRGMTIVELSAECRQLITGDVKRNDLH